MPFISLIGLKFRKKDHSCLTSARDKIFEWIAWAKFKYYDFAFCILMRVLKKIKSEVWIKLGIDWHFYFY